MAEVWFYHLDRSSLEQALPELLLLQPETATTVEIAISRTRVSPAILRHMVVPSRIGRLRRKLNRPGARRAEPAARRPRMR